MCLFVTKNVNNPSTISYFSAYSEEEVKKMQDQIELDRKTLAERKDILEEERQKISVELEKREKDLVGIR